MNCATTVKFVLGPETQWESQRIADVIAHRLRKQPGCESFVFMGDYDTGEYEWVVFWDTLRHAETAYEEHYEEFCGMVGDAFQWRPAISLYQVYEAKS